MSCVREMRPQLRRRFVPVPYVEVAKHSASYFLVELVHSLLPCRAPSMEPNPLRYPNGVAEGFPEGINASLALPLQSQNRQVLHTEHCASHIKPRADGGQLLGDIMACVADVG